MHRERYTRIRRRHESNWRRDPRSLHQLRLRFDRSHANVTIFRVAAVTILFFICGLVLSLASIAEPRQKGRFSSSAHGVNWLPATGSDSPGPVLSIDLDITDDPGDEVATSHWTSPFEGYLELHGKPGIGERVGYKLLARVDAGPVIELDKVLLDYDSECPPGGASGRSSAVGLDSSEAEPGSVASENSPMWAALIVAKANYDQSAGAMSNTTVSTAYAWNGRMLVEVWSATTRSEAVWNMSWGPVGSVKANSWRWGVARERTLRDFVGVGPGDDVAAMAAAKGLNLGPGNWVRLASLSTVEFVSGVVPSVVMKSLHEYHSYSEKDDTFKLISSREVRQTFCWSDRWNAFVLGEGTVGREGAVGMEYPGANDGVKIHPGTDLAILESERKCVEGLVFGPPFLLRVKLPDGRRYFVDEETVLTSGLESMV